jgi:hypothetical protein
MKNDFVSPNEFPEKHRFDGHEITYQNLLEIVQGGPIVGSLFIDGRRIGSNLLFGGPFLIEEGILYIPLFVRKFCISGFKLCQIDLRTLEFTLSKRVKDLIYLSHIDNGKIFFYENIDKENAELKHMAL